MAGSVLVDTNVLVYATGVDGPVKAAVADAVTQRMVARGNGALSTQVLSEYANTMLRRYPRTSGDVVAADLEDLRGDWHILLVTDEVIAEAVRGTIEHGLSFYDAQIWAAARLAGIDTVLTEDFSDGRVLEGVRFVDPFAPGFDPHSLTA